MYVSSLRFRTWFWDSHLCCSMWYTIIKRETKVMTLKVARSSFWVTIPLNFKQLVYHSEQPNRKSIVTGDLEKDESFTWGTFHRNRSYHSNVMNVIPRFTWELITCHQETILGSARLDLRLDIFVFTSTKFEEFL